MCKSGGVCTCLVPCTHCLCSIDVGKDGAVKSVFLRNDPDVATITYEDRRGDTKVVTYEHAKHSAKGLRINL